MIPLKVLQTLVKTKLTALAIGLGAVMTLTTLAVGASLLASNVLTLGPISLSGEPVRLTSTTSLPATLRIGDHTDVLFRLQNTGATISNATLMVRVAAAGTPLTDPYCVTLEFRDPVSGNDQTVTLAVANGGLEGTLKSGWTIPADYSNDLRLRITFNSSAPLASYSVDMWVERPTTSGADPTPTPTPSGGNQQTPQTYTVQMTDSDVFVPANLTAKVADTVQWTNVGSKPHNVVFSNPSIPSNNFIAGGASYQVTFSAAGTFSYVCQFHSGMSGTVVVQP
ncbi:MAG: cupredoxin domain-containing protein [Chloroflexi bacterium]|nr:cupredoxin domain-containing protein [Chloroflexota bacterium]